MTKTNGQDHWGNGRRVGPVDPVPSPTIHERAIQLFNPGYPAPVNSGIFSQQKPFLISLNLLRLRKREVVWWAWFVSVVSFLLLAFLPSGEQHPDRYLDKGREKVPILASSSSLGDHCDSMADEAMVNGVDDPEVQNPRPADQPGIDSEVNDLTLKLKLLELEKFNLLRENDETKGRVGELMTEIEKLKSDEGEMRAKLEKMGREVELAEDGKRAMESIMKRAGDLEIEVSRLQHDLISAMNDADEANKEAAKLRSAAEEKGRRVEGLEREVEGLKNGRAESDIKVRELERKIGALEVRESEARSEKVRAEMELREKVEEKEREISGLKQKIQDLEVRIAEVVSELQSSKNEKMGAEDALKKSEEKAKEMESKLVELQRELEQAGKVICGLKDKTTKTINGGREIAHTIEDKGSKLQWPVVAAGSTGAIVVAAAAAYVCYSRRQS